MVSFLSGHLPSDEPRWVSERSPPRYLPLKNRQELRTSSFPEREPRSLSRSVAFDCGFRQLSNTLSHGHLRETASGHTCWCDQSATSSDFRIAGRRRIGPKAPSCMGAFSLLLSQSGLIISIAAVAPVRVREQNHLSGGIPVGAIDVSFLICWITDALAFEGASLPTGAPVRRSIDPHGQYAAC
jgi:hypothetical protein